MVKLFKCKCFLTFLIPYDGYVLMIRQNGFFVMTSFMRCRELVMVIHPPLTDEV